MALDFNTPALTGSSQSGDTPSKSPFSGQGKTKVADSDRMHFTDQLAMMIDVGTDLHSALLALARQTENPSMKSIISGMAEDISDGKTYSAALARHPEVFSPTYVNLVAAGESGGFIGRVLKHLLKMEQQREELRTTLVSALAYPAFLIVFSLAVVVFVLAVVFPKFETLFASIHDQLPITTLILMGMSDVITDYWWLLGIGLVVAVWGVASWLRAPAGSRWLDRTTLTLPVVKDVFLQTYLIQTMRIISLSLTNGVPLVEALNLCKGVVKNQLYTGFIDRILSNVNEGRGFARGFDETEFLPPILGQMITTGEETGNLPLVTERIADHCQSELEKKLKLLSKFIEPVMLLVMGLIVGLLVSSLILPIFKLSRAVH